MSPIDDIQINTGEKVLTINGDPLRTIRFNPDDLVFAEKFYNLISTFEAKSEEYIQRNNALEADKRKGADGLPINTPERLALLREACLFLRGQIDDLFGAGTSQTVFGDAINLNMFEQFFSGVLPYITAARTPKLQPYLKQTAEVARRRHRK